MNLFKNKLFAIYIALATISYAANAQNLFDLEHSLKFAEYLFENNLYKEAAAEYERVIFLDSMQFQAKIQCIKAYEYAGNFSVAQKKLSTFFVDMAAISPEVSYLKYRLFLLNNELNRFVIDFAANNNFQPIDKLILASTAAIFAGNFDTAKVLVTNKLAANSELLQQYSGLLQNSEALKYKSPVLAVTLSTIVPGAGKVYTGYWKDGLITFIFTGLSAWQAYRGFEKSGVKSTYGWIYAGMTAGFYLGNIYGAGKSAYKHNHEKKHKIIHRAEAIFSNYRR